MEFIIGRKGNQKTQITDPTVSRQHCKVTSNGDGTYTIENLSQSGTKVDGREIVRASAGLNSIIQLGQSFKATLAELIGTPAQASAPTSRPSAPSQTVKTFNISHLRRVWEDHNRKNLEMAEVQRKSNLVRTGSSIFTMSAAIVASLTSGPIGWIFTGIGVIGMVYSFIGLKNTETVQEKQQRQEAFDDAWVCPNPECRHSLTAKNYKYLVKNFQSCPYCKCKYIEK